jgi:TonB family protein
MLRRYRTIGALLLVLAVAPAVAQTPPEAPKLTKAPKLLHFVEAPFPESERAAGRTATVQLRLTLNEKGAVTAADVTGPASPAFDAAAQAAALQFTFEPAEIDGKPAAIRILFKYEFTLKAAAPTPAIFAGKVRDRATRKPVPAVLIDLDTGAKATTGADGTFEIKNVPPGAHGVGLSGAGLTSVRTQETFVAGERLEVSYDISLPAPEAPPGEQDDLEIVVVAPPLQKQAVSTTVAADQAAKVPGAQGDVLKVVESMPGVARASAGSAALIVWGAAPGDTRTYVDGVPIPQLYHQGGLRSVVGSDLVKSVELVPGGYGSAHGGGLGGIVVVETKPLENDGLHASASADLFEASGMLRTSIAEKWRVEAAGQISYLDVLAKQFVSPQVEEFFPFPRFHDAQARVRYQVSPRESVELVGLLSGDRTSSGVANADPNRSTRETRELNFYRLYLRYQNELAAGATVTVRPYFGVDQASLTDAVGSRSTYQRDAATLGGLRASWHGVLAPWLTAEAGLDAHVRGSSLAQSGSPSNPPREGDPHVFGQPPPDQLNADTWQTLLVDAAPYVELDLSFFDKTLHLTPGLRFDPYARSISRSLPASGNTPAIGLYEQNFALEPRFAARWEFHPRANVHVAVGRYNQAPAAEDLSAVFGNPTLPTSSATQALAGAAVKLTEKLTTELTGFWTQSSALAVRSTVSEPLAGQALVAVGSGRAYGGQILLRQEKTAGFFGWISYTLSRSERQDAPGGRWRLSDYDQTPGDGLRDRLGTRGRPAPALRDGLPSHTGRWLLLRHADRSMGATLRRRQHDAHPRLLRDGSPCGEGMEDRREPAGGVVRYSERHQPGQSRRGRLQLGLLPQGLHHRSAHPAGPGGSMVALRHVAWLAPVALLGCIPNVAINDSLVTEPRIVAMRSVPAEAKPGTTVQWTALVVAPESAPEPTISWTLCKARKALSETGPVSAGCFTEDPANVTSVGSGASVSAPVSADACRLYGPDPPLAKPGEPAGRSVDPDSTGGYYLPLVMHADDATLGQTRITCGVASATQEQSAEFVSRYRANENPSVESLSLGGTLISPAGAGDAPSVQAGSRHALVLTWPDCTGTTAACGGAEPYVVFSPTALRIEEHRESLHIAWYTTAGAFQQARGGVSEAGASQHTLSNEWTAPSVAGDVTLWVVLLDDRGGAGWQRYLIHVVE